MFTRLYRWKSRFTDGNFSRSRVTLNVQFTNHDCILFAFPIHALYSGQFTDHAKPLPDPEETGARFSKDPITYWAHKAIFLSVSQKENNTYIGIKLCMEVNFVRILKLCEKNSSANIRFKIFVTAFRARKLFGTFEKCAPGHALLLISSK